AAPAPPAAPPLVAPAPTPAARPVTPAAAAPPPPVAAPSPRTTPLPVVVVAPIPRSSEEAAPRRSAAAAWSLLVGGLAVSFAGAALVAISQNEIEDRRTTLEQACMTFSGPDTCKVAKAHAGDQAAAQTAENDIVTWKGVRLGAEIGIGVGAALAVT